MGSYITNINKKAGNIAVISALLLLAGCSQTYEPDTAVPAGPQYPDTPTVSQIDTYHGIEVADPYRWLEDMNSEQTQQWVNQQNRLTFPYLESLSTREFFKDRLTQVWNYERLSTPFRVHDLYFYYRNQGLQNQSVLYVTDDVTHPGRVLIDPNQLSDDGTVSLSRVYVSPRANYIAYGVSDGGSDWVEFKVRDITTGEDLITSITGTKFTNLTWLPDESGFYYSRYPDGDDGLADDQQTVQIYFHQLGTVQSADEQIYAVDSERPINPYPTVTSDGRFLMATHWDGYIANAVYVLDRSDATANWQPLFDAWDGLYSLIETDGNIFYFSTTQDAPTGRVIAVDVNNPAQENWQEIIPARDETLGGISYVGGTFFASYLKDAQSMVHLYDAHGRFQQALELPEIGTVSGFSGDKNHRETFFRLTGFTQPGAVYRFDISDGSIDLHQQTQVNAELSGYVTEQVFYESKDGTRIPMFIVRHESTALDGNAPLLLHGYGGFNVSITPGFSPARLVWLEQGGILALPNLRGGGEYGFEWHQAGTRLNKQNVFDDFIAAAEYLIEHQYTNPNRLAIQGGSNGGLLVAAVTIQRPELFAATLPAVGVLDMLRYHTPSANARAWSDDYGLSENRDEFEALYAYSPIHNTEAGVCYPATLITTGDHDDRVVPWHSYKYAAVMQRDQGCDNPILLRVETRAGHGAGTPTWMRIEQIADQWAFLVEHLGVEHSRN
ncbi:prolyl oligopeptidase family serine peptidase [Aliidiomarina indica]|uniref:prolyl oligopeptidase family serine peptidase n=1 Tax=Aliidiomarina indica TaxID=2749147 RepID=UPI00188F79A8|nr:prolyl oligopeptidase family serine peptidase [Aliidiomarina indica]